MGPLIVFFPVTYKSQKKEMIKNAEVLNEIDFLKNILPKDWKVINVNAKVGKTTLILIISPEGKRFTSLEAAHEYLENEREEKASSKTKFRTKICFSPTSVGKFQMKFRETKKKDMNLLKKTLDNNHVLKVLDQNDDVVKYQKSLIRKRNLFLWHRMQMRRVSKGA